MKRTFGKAAQIGLIGVLLWSLIAGPTLTVWAADLDTEAQQEAAVRAAWQAKLGHELVTEAYWPGKTWYNVKAKAVVYDGNSQKGKAFYDQFMTTYLTEIPALLGLKVEVSFADKDYKGGVTGLKGGDIRLERQKIADTYARDDRYQLISWYNDGVLQEGTKFGAKGEHHYTNNALFWGADLGYFGYQGFNILVDATWTSKLRTDYSIPASAGYYITQNTAAQFEKWMADLQTPFSEWDCYSQSVYTHEQYDVAEKLGRNDFLKVPPRDPNSVAHYYGIWGAEQNYQRGPWDGKGDEAWFRAVAQKYHDENLTTKKDAMGNYNNIAWALFLYFNDLPLGTEPIFPADVKASAGGQAPPAPSNPPASSGNTAMDAWAAAEVEPMIAAGMIPVTLQKGYQGAISRLEYAQVAAQALRAKYSLDDSALLTKFGKKALPASTFSDTSDKDVLLVAALGLVEGTGGGKFSPAATLTREQAATILSRLATLVGRFVGEPPLNFSDKAQVSAWAVEGVNTVSRITAVGGGKRVMEGDSSGKFNPKDAYQRQQCYATLGRMLGLPL